MTCTIIIVLPVILHWFDTVAHDWIYVCILYFQLNGDSSIYFCWKSLYWSWLDFLTLQSYQLYLYFLVITSFFQDIEATIHCAEWLSIVGGSSTGDQRVRYYISGLFCKLSLLFLEMNDLLLSFATFVLLFCCFLIP